MKDWLAIACSSICVIHCLLTPALMLLGATGVSILWVGNERIHQALVIPIVALACWSLSSGWRFHRQRRPIAFAALGVLFLFSALIAGERHEVILTLSAGLLLVLAHVMNLKLVKKVASP